MNDPGSLSWPTLSSQPAASYTIDDDPFVSLTEMDMFRVSKATSDYIVRGIRVHEPPPCGLPPYPSYPRAVSPARLHSTTRFASPPTRLPNQLIDAIRELTQNTPLRPPHARSATARSSLPFLAPERPSNRSPRASTISVRVVNFASSSLKDEDHVRLGSDDGDGHVVEGDNDGVVKVGQPLPNSWRSILPLHTRILWADQSRPARDVRFFDILGRDLFSA